MHIAVSLQMLQLLVEENRMASESGSTSCDELIKAIGLIVVCFEGLNNSVSSGIWSLLKINRLAGECITSELSFKGSLHLFSSLYRLECTDVAKIKELAVILKKANQAEEKRNIIMHSAWGLGSEYKGELLRIKSTAKMSKGLNQQFEEMSVGDLHAISSEIAEASSIFSRFFINHMLETSKPRTTS